MSIFLNAAKNVKYPIASIYVELYSYSDHSLEPSTMLRIVFRQHKDFSSNLVLIKIHIDNKV